MKLIMAPMLAITDVKFRNVYNKYFPDFDYAITPFVSLSTGNKITKKSFRDFIPQEQTMKIVPQLLNHDANTFVEGVRYLHSMGYQEINLNLGCPDPGILRKGRGAFLLDQAEVLDSKFEKIFNELQASDLVSLKIRGGNKSFDNLPKLIEVINKYPFKNVTLHARSALQMYQGRINLDVVDYVYANLKHKLIFNGDITSVEVFKIFASRYQKIDAWMIGRGFLRNPFLPMMIKKNNSGLYDSSNIISWNTQLFKEFKDFSHNDMYVLGRMKNLWKYLGYSFSNSERFMKEVLTCLDASRFLHLTNDILRREEFIGESNV